MRTWGWLSLRIPDLSLLCPRKTNNFPQWLPPFHSRALDVFTRVCLGFGANLENIPALWKIATCNHRPVKSQQILRWSLRLIRNAPECSVLSLNTLVPCGKETGGCFAAGLGVFLLFFFFKLIQNNLQEHFFEEKRQLVENCVKITIRGCFQGIIYLLRIPW